MKEVDINAYIEGHEPQDSRYQHLVPISLSQTGNTVTLMAAPIGSESRIFVQHSGLLKPQPLFVEHYHDDSDDDPWAVDGYDITRVSGFYIDPESEKLVYALHCENDDSIPRVETGFTFCRREDDSNDLKPITIFDRQETCRFIRLDLGV